SGDLLAIMSSGAYAMVMASNYNARRRAAEVMVDGDKFFVIRNRETFEHLLFDEKII
ncbi:MAG: diaminopimelate decarboxylase, partial [Ignavibacteriaceae bacterium]